MIGTTIRDRFQFSERLTRQGPVELYEGLDLEAGQVIWIKRFTSPLDQDLDFIENWRAQLLSVQVVQDERLPVILDFGRSNEGDLFQVETPPRGRSLRRFSATRAPMGVAAAVSLVAAVARAVGSAHREGVAHGGLALDSIYVEEVEGERLDLFVTGWELGEVVVALRHAAEPVPERLGRYLAPEQRHHPAPPATPATDVYALGSILYELLTGTRPTPPDPDDLYHDPPAPRRFNPEVSRAVERELLRALAADPATRHPNGTSLAQALVGALREPEVVTVPPIVEERVETVTVRPPRWLPAVALLATLLICTLLFLLVWTNRGEEAAALPPPTPTVRVVPDLDGPPYLRYNDAVARAWNEGFVVSIVNFVEGDTLPPGVVVAQCPPAGALPDAIYECPPLGVPVAEDMVLVEVSSLPEPVVLRVVPDLYGQPEPEARTVLQQGALRVGTSRAAYDSMMPAGRIIEQNPRRGLGVLPGTAVDIIVSAGPAPGGEFGLVNPTPVAGGVVPPPDLLPTTTAGAVYPPPEVVPLPTESPTGSVLELPTATATATATRAVLELPTATVTVTATESAGSDPAAIVLLEDDFESGNVLGWQMTEDEGQSAAIANGVFTVTLSEPGLFWKSEVGQLFADYTYQAEVILAPDTLESNGGAGLVFRSQDDEHFYWFEVNGEGQYRLRARDGDSWITLLEWERAPAIFPAGFPNLLQVTVEGERLTLFVNEEQLAVVDTPPDITYLNGDIGVGLESESAPIDAIFDNVLVTR